MAYGYKSFFEKDEDEEEIPSQPMKSYILAMIAAALFTSCLYI